MVSSLQAAITALVADVVAVAVGFGVMNNTLAGTITTALVGRCRSRSSSLTSLRRPLPLQASR